MWTASLAKWLKRPPRKRKIPGSNPACDGIFPGQSHTRVTFKKNWHSSAAVPGVWRFRVSAGTGWSGVSIPSLGEMESFDLQLLSRSVPEIHAHVAGTFSNQPTNKLCRGHLKSGRPGAGIMEADDRQVTTVLTVQPSFRHRHSTNRVS